MKLSWSKYELSKSYDEYITPKRTVRGHLRKIGNFFESLSHNDLQELDSATKSAIKSMAAQRPTASARCAKRDF